MCIRVDPFLSRKSHEYYLIMTIGGRRAYSNLNVYVVISINGIFTDLVNLRSSYRLHTNLLLFLRKSVRETRCCNVYNVHNVLFKMNNNNKKTKSFRVIGDFAEKKTILLCIRRIRHVLYIDVKD